MDNVDNYREILKLLYVFSFSLGLWTCLNMLVNKPGPRGARLSLLVFLAVLLFVPLNGYLGLVMNEAVELLDSVASTISWCYGPLMLILINNVLRRQPHTYLPLVHFLPFALFAAAHFFHMDGWVFDYYLFLLLSQLSLYLLLTLRLVYQHRQRLLMLGKEFRNSAYYWMLYLVAGLFVLALYDLALMFAIHYGLTLNFYFVSTTACGFCLYLSTICIFLLVQPNAFESEPGPESSQEDEEAHEQKLRYVELSAEAAIELAEKLNALIDQHKPHLDAEISLSKLAALLGVTTHQLSELLNIHLETSFYDFLNHLRYKEAVRLMENYPDNYSITDIAYLAGFNNRNSFYKVFRKYQGVTPGEYRKQCAQTV